MNVLILNGSPRKNGKTATLLKHLAQKYVPNSTYTLIHVYDLNFKPCRSCYGCRPDKCCILPLDDASKLWHDIRSCDILIVGSPTYYGNISGMLKLLFDRLLTAFEYMPADGMTPPHSIFPHKKAIIATTCNTPEPYCNNPDQAAGTLKCLENILHAGGYDIIEKIISAPNYDSYSF